MSHQQGGYPQQGYPSAPPQQGGYGAHPPQGGHPGSPNPAQPYPSQHPPQQGAHPGSPNPQQPYPSQHPQQGGYPGSPNTTQPGQQPYPSQHPPQQGGYPGSPNPQQNPSGAPPHQSPQQGGYPGSPNPAQPYPSQHPPQQGGHPGSPNPAQPYPSQHPGSSNPAQPYPSQHPPQQGAYPGAPPQQGGYPGAPGSPNPSGAPPQQGGHPGATNPHASPSGAPPQQGGYPGAPPQQGGYPGSPPPQGGYPGAPPQQGGYGAPPQQGGYGAPPQQGGYGAPPQGGYGAPSPYGAYPPQQGGYGAPPQHGAYGAPPQHGGYGAPAPYGAYPPQQGGYGAPPQQGGFGAPSPYGAPPQSFAPQVPTDQKLMSMEVTVQAARALTSMDSNGKSDPYVTTSLPPHAGTYSKTKVVYKSLNPVWSERFILTQDQLNKSGSYNEVKFELYDHDVVGAHDYMGTVSIPFSSLPWDQPVDKWYSISDKRTSGSRRSKALTGELNVIITKKSQYASGAHPGAVVGGVAPSGLGAPHPGGGGAPVAVSRGLEAPGASGLKFFQHVQSTSHHQGGGGGQYSGRDFILVIDKSGSMTGSCWSEARKALTILAPFVVRADPDGVTLYFFSDGGKYPRYDNVRDEDAVMRAFQKESPGGSTDLAGVLKVALKEAATNMRNHRKATTVLVITDGEPNDRSAVKKVIKESASHLERDEDLSISFIQIGSDKSAAKFLKELDDDRYSKFDIVDTMTAERMKSMSFSDFIQLSVYD